MYPQSAFGAMANFGMGYGYMGGMQGLADFGTQIRPVSYTPPAIAMQPHFGMIQVQQSLSQAGLASLGPFGMAMGNPLSTRDLLPMQISMAEYAALSGRSFGARLGDATAVGALTTAGTLGSLAGGGLGMAAGSSLFNSTLGRGIGGFMGGAAAGMAVSAYFGEVADMTATNRAVQNQLAAGSFRFMTGGPDADPLTGRGFPRGARAQVADYVQSQELQDVRFGMPEMRNILESGMQMDMFSGTRDVGDFKQKFRSLVDNLKTITATLHTSLQEGMEVMRGFRDAGVTDPGQINRTVMGARGLSRVGKRRVGLPTTQPPPNDGRGRAR